MTTATTEAQDEEFVFGDLYSLPKPDPSWAPAHYSKSLSPLTRGTYVAEFVETFMKVPQGKKELVGKALMLTDWQKWLINSVLEEDPETGFYRYKRVLIGVPRKNGKSLLGSALALHALIFSQPGSQIYSAAKTREQANIIFDRVQAQAIKNPWIAKRLKITNKYIENKSTGVRYRSIASDAKAAQGLGASLVLADELHIWTTEGRSTAGEDLWAALTEGSSDRDESLVIAITTAGGRKDNLCGKLYEHGVKVSNGEIEDKYFGFFWWEASEDMDPYDPETWKRANPNMAVGLLNPENFEASLKIAGSTDFYDFLRYSLNQWTRLKGKDYIIGSKWTQAEEKDGRIEEGSRITLGFDGSVDDDSTAIVAMDCATGLFEVKYIWERPKGDDDYVVPKDEVIAAFEELFENYDVAMVYADNAYWGSETKALSKKYPRRVSSFNANAIRMAPMSRDFLQDLYSQEITHCGQEEMTRHAMNAIMSDAGIPLKEKKGSPNKIDALYAALLANGARRHVLARRERAPLPSF